MIKYYGDRPSAYDTITDLNELFLHNPKQISDNFNELIKEDCKLNNLCPVCYNQLSTKTVKNETVEYMGTQVNEPIHIKYCEQCGWSEE